MLANIKTALAARRIRQTQLARANGVPESTISEFIHERCELPPHFRARIAEMLQADRAWLFSQATPHIPALHPEFYGSANAATAAG
jgi:plasmid maintenance system antidote protein VapI